MKSFFTLKTSSKQNFVSSCDKLYKSSFEVSWYQNDPRISLEFILSAHLSKDSAIIDVGGGASFLVDHLIKEKFNNVSVLDISENALSISKKRLDLKGKNVKWIVADITKFDTPYKFSLWHDRALFHFLTDPLDRKKYINNLKKKIIPEGHFIIATFAFGGPEKCSGLKIVQYDSEKIKRELGEEFVLLKQRIESHITPSNRIQKFIFFHFKRIS